MIIIEEEIDVPDYFRRGELEPVLICDVASRREILHIYKSSETSESGASSHIILKSEDLVSILVGYYFSGLGRKARAKTRGGQFWRHYKNGIRLEWREIPDEDRLRILEACDLFAPPWAKAPGKLAADRHKPRHHERVEYDSAGAIVGYKYLTFCYKLLEEPVFRSQWSPMKFEDGKTQTVNIIWRDNFLEADQIPSEDNTNGIYAAKTFDSPILAKYSGRAFKDGKPDRYHSIKLVRLLLSGTVLEPERGFGYRAERADIIQVFDSGRWVEVKEFIKNEYRREEEQSPQDTEADQG